MAKQITTYENVDDLADFMASSGLVCKPALNHFNIHVKIIQTLRAAEGKISESQFPFKQEQARRARQGSRLLAFQEVVVPFFGAKQSELTKDLDDYMHRSPLTGKIDGQQRQHGFASPVKPASSLELRRDSAADVQSQTVHNEESLGVSRSLIFHSRGESEQYYSTSPSRLAVATPISRANPASEFSSQWTIKESLIKTPHGPPKAVKRPMLWSLAGWDGLVRRQILPAHSDSASETVIPGNESVTWASVRHQRLVDFAEREKEYFGIVQSPFWREDFEEPLPEWAVSENERILWEPTQHGRLVQLFEQEKKHHLSEMDIGLGSALLEWDVSESNQGL